MVPPIQPIRPKILDVSQKPELRDEIVKLVESSGKVGVSLGKMEVKFAYISFGNESVAFRVEESDSSELVAVAVGAEGHVGPDELLSNLD